MVKLPKLDHVKFVRSKGSVYAYFNTGKKVDGKPVYVRLPAPSSPDFYSRYGALVAGRTKRATADYTVASLIDDYTRSVEFRGRAANTQKSYNIQLEKVRGRLGKLSVNQVTPKHVRAILDKEGWGAATQNIFVAVIGSLYAWGRKRDKAAIEPTKDIGKLKTGQHEPWPDDIIYAALACEDARVRLAVHLLYYTGQRIGDVCALRWGNIRAGRVKLTQQKGGKTLSIRIHRDLQAELDRTPRQGITILTGANGCAVSPETIREELQAFTMALGVKTVPHGLRKNAVITLLEEGCTVAEVASITGQTFEVVEHYAARVNNDKLSDTAMLKFEGRQRRT